MKITRITVTHYHYEVSDLGMEERLGFDIVYQPGSHLPVGGAVLTLETNAGIQGEVPGSIDRRSATYLLGRNPVPPIKGQASSRGHEFRNSCRFHAPDYIAHLLPSVI